MPPWGTRTPYGAGEAWPRRVDSHLQEGIKDADLLALTKRCHPDTLRQVRWANAKLEESSTQILVS